MVANINEHARVRRRIEALRAPHFLSMEERAYSQEDAMDLAENERKPIPPWLDFLLMAICLAAAGVVLYGVGQLVFE
jgi:hypothetical protein